MANKVRKKDEAKKENHLCDKGFAAWSFTVAAEWTDLWSLFYEQKAILDISQSMEFHDRSWACYLYNEM